MKKLLCIPLIIILSQSVLAFTPPTMEQKEIVITAYSEVIASHPDFLPLYTGLVIASINMDFEPNQAEQALAKLQNLEGGSRMAEFLSVALANAKNDKNGALNALKKYLAKDPFAAFQIHQYPNEQAIAGMAEGINLKSHLPPTPQQFRPNPAYLDHAKRRESRLREYISQNPKESQAVYYFALHLLADERFKEANIILEKLAFDRPNDGLSWALWGMAQDLLGNSDQALEHYLKALTIPFTDWTDPERLQAERLGLDEELSWLMPPDGSYFIEYTWRHLALAGKLSQALTLLENFPNSLYSVRAYLRWKLGDIEGARRELRGSQIELNDNSIWGCFSHHVFISSILELNGLTQESEKAMEKAFVVPSYILAYPVGGDVLDYVRNMRYASFYEEYTPMSTNTIPLNELNKEKDPLDHPLVGKSIPDVELVDMDDRAYLIAPPPGKWMVVEFWMTTCAPCVRELAELKKLKENRTDLTLLSVNLAESKERILAYQQERGMDFPSVRAGKSQVETFKILATPTIFLIDPNGIIKAVFQGFTESAQIEKFMQQ